MFKLRSLFFALSTFALLTSCGGDDEPDPGPGPSTGSGVLESSSITEGQVVDASTSQIVLTYSNPIRVSSANPATLNSKALNDYTATGRTLTLRFSLEEGTQYTLVIPNGYVSINGHSMAEYKLNFSTAAPVVPPTPGESVAAKLVTPSPSAEAVKLYDFFKSIYGKKQLSGAMGEVAWGTAYVDAIAQKYGKYTAIVGFDYIHIPYSPANWIDYSDITPVKKVWDAGSIPAVTWHWNVPDGKGRYTTDSKAPFSPSKIFVNGSDEQRIAEADVAEMAASLTKLRDAGIPVIFRPFHEAAGDYTWGTWFWWGKEGVEVTKQLYGWLFNKLTNEYKLNNLVWVWTVQCTREGKPTGLADLRSAYPGDNYVDIVGPDIYDEPLSDQSGYFNLVNSLVEGRKMVALTETGNLLDPTVQFKNHTLWLYFMSWYEWCDSGAALGTEWNKNGEWGKVLSNPYVLNRGDFSIK